MNTLERFEQVVNETAIHPDRHCVGGLAYAVLGLAGEAGEIAEKVKKAIRDERVPMTAHCSNISPERRATIVQECGDVLWYVTNILQQLDCDLEIAMLGNVKKLLDRKARNVLKGDGDER